MLFNSYSFAAFFVVVYAVYLLTLRRLAMQNAFLLVASYFFYGCWDWRFLGLIAFSTLVDFGCGLLLDRRATVASHDPQPDREPPYRYSPTARRQILLLSIASNLGILGFFKYYDFFATGLIHLLSVAGLSVRPSTLHVILPVGISFYTFQALSYTIDVYRGKLRVCRRLTDFALLIAFFPQLVAGPIVRAVDLLPQVTRRRHLDLSQIYDGAALIFFGLFKKIVIADNLAVMVDGVFKASDTPQGGTALVAVYAFALQIYCDFSGYSDIARGLAKTLGFEFCENFNLPYLASNPSEFWRRWHISLSSWLRDYLYVPLGGNRRGPRRTYINLMLTMTLGGLWHGAAWTFVAWGAYHGLLLALHRALRPWIESVTRTWSPNARRMHHGLAVVGFFQLTCLGWLLFRAESVTQAWQWLAAMINLVPVGLLHGIDLFRGTGVTLLAACASALLFVEIAQRRRVTLGGLPRLPALARGVAYSILFYGLILFGDHGEQPFIYFQF